MIAVGIDVAEERKGLDLVALDADRQVVHSEGGLTVARATDLVLDDLRPEVVCIDAPSGWSLGGKSRQAERDLAKQRISAFPTGPDPGDHPFYRWMRVGIELFDAIAERYPRFCGEDGEELSGRAAEVFPNATAILLAGRRRTEGESKLRFRRAVLRDNGVNDQPLPGIDRVDAALAALTGILALEGTWTCVGDPKEGVILLPAVAGRPGPSNVSRLPVGIGTRRDGLRRKPKTGERRHQERQGIDMGLIDKAKNATQRATGQAKEAVGKHTDNPDLEAEGKKDQVAGGLKDAGEKLKDAGRKAKGTVTD